MSMRGEEGGKGARPPPYQQSTGSCREAAILIPAHFKLLIIHLAPYLETCGSQYWWARGGP